MELWFESDDSVAVRGALEAELARPRPLGLDEGTFAPAAEVCRAALAQRSIVLDLLVVGHHSWQVDYPREGEPDYVRRYGPDILTGGVQTYGDVLEAAMVERLREACDL